MFTGTKHDKLTECISKILIVMSRFSSFFLAYHMGILCKFDRIDRVVSPATMITQNKCYMYVLIIS